VDRDRHLLHGAGLVGRGAKLVACSGDTAGRGLHLADHLQQAAAHRGERVAGLAQTVDHQVDVARHRTDLVASARLDRLSRHGCLASQVAGGHRAGDLGERGQVVGGDPPGHLDDLPHGTGDAAGETNGQDQTGDKGDREQRHQDRLNAVRLRLGIGGHALARLSLQLEELGEVGDLRASVLVRVLGPPCGGLFDLTGRDELEPLRARLDVLGVVAPPGRQCLALFGGQGAGGVRLGVLVDLRVPLLLVGQNLLARGRVGSHEVGDPEAQLPDRALDVR
jgi:hypothetical protein